MRATAEATVFLALTLLAVLPLPGCVAVETAGGDSPAAVDRTGGVRLDLLVEQARQVAARYIVKEDGTIAFGGGRRGIAGNTEWTGDLTDEEIVELNRLLTTHAWFTTDPVGSAGPDDEFPRYTARVTGPAGFNRFKTSGESDAITSVHDLLDTAARRRFADVLDELPKAGQVR